MSLSSETPKPRKEPRTPITRGAFILIEGLDRAGKTTQVQRLCSKLDSLGHNVRTIRFPDRTSPIGKMIDSYLQTNIEMDDHVIHLLFSANRWEKAKWMEDTLAAGYTIVCDRYYYSGIVYSAAKQNPSLSLEWAKTPDIGLPQPDITIFLDLEPEEAEKRGGYGSEKYEKKEMQERVRALFLGLIESEVDEVKMKVVNAGASVDVVEERVYQEVASILAAVQNGQLGDKVRRIEA